MSASYGNYSRRSRAQLDNDDDPGLGRAEERQDVQSRFAILHEELLDGAVEATPMLELHRRFKQAAHEAASLAWMTGYPLLTFPALFEELARRERANATRQERIRARTEQLMEQNV